MQNTSNMKTPRGLRNNNPLNIRHSRDVFAGEIFPGADKSFKQFENMSHGYRAAFIILGSYLARGINTIEKIIKTWAPPIENDTENYINIVARKSGIDRQKILTNTSGADYKKIVAEMAYVECGQPATIADLEAGFNMQGKIK